ncbi:hypothetical protein [Nostoc sp.]|uniref:hypothetical protein n=1 Tax=Nostoc sp. TaxID=1180 RepID=UPI002FF466A7
MLTECDVIIAEVPTEKESYMVNIRENASFKYEEMSQPLDAFELDATALEQYYSALAKVESKYKELLKVQNEFKWYESKLQEADELAAKLDIQKPSKLSVETFRGSNLLTIGVVESAIGKAHNKVAEHENVQKLLHETISRLQKEFNEHMSALRKQHQETISNLQNEINLNLSNFQYHLDNFKTHISNNLQTVENLKTKRMIEILLIVLAGIGSVLVIQNIIVVVISMLIIWGIRACMH